ncbi:MAG: hypothetical protein ACTSRG_09835 [Candidatus Helarchaeota archaeon]
MERSDILTIVALSVTGLALVFGLLSFIASLQMNDKLNTWFLIIVTDLLFGFT